MDALKPQPGAETVLDGQGMDGMRAAQSHCFPQDLPASVYSRIVVIAPHPDDEVLALGATLATLARDGFRVLICAVTDGEASHVGSVTWSEQRLQRTRPLESKAALKALGLPAEVLRFGLPDGALAGEAIRLGAALADVVRTGDTVFVPWREDGHADHEACAHAALAVCEKVGARCIEFPVWALVPSHPAHAGLARRRLKRIDVPAELARRKVDAIQAFHSQTVADGETPPVLHPAARSVWQQPCEWVMA